jgi:hypothetical protein
MLASALNSRLLIAPVNAGPQRSEEELDRRDTIERLAEALSPCAASASFNPPPPDEPQRVGSDAEAAAGGPERAQRSEPDLLRPFRQQPGVEYASAGRNLRSPVEAYSFLPDNAGRPLCVSSFVVRLRLLQLRLLWQVGGIGSPSFNNRPARSSARAARVASRP